MKRIYIRIILLLFTGCMFSAKAQDVRFSQFINAPLYVNPANAGNGIEYMRATLIYRNQWASVASPFVTEGFMIDKKVNKIGFGFYVVKNSAGKSSLKQLNLAGTMSYNQPIGENNQITGAIQLGMMHKSFDPSEMTFDSQYSEDLGFDPSANSGEIFTNTSITRPDLGAGFMWQRGFGKPKLKFKPFVGFAFSHLNKPSETFIVDQNKLPVRTTINFGAGFMIKENVEIKPAMIYMIQDHAHEFNYGAITSFVLANENKFQVGLFNRKNDAIIAYAGYQVKQLFIGTSYDINVSGLKEVSHGNGGFELSLTYIPKAKKKNRPDEYKATQKPAAKKEKMKKAAPAEIKPFELSISIPDQLAIAKQPVVSETKKVTPATVKEKPINAVKELQTAKPVAQEIKPIVRQDISPVIAKEISAVKEKKTNIPSKLKQPVYKNIITPKPNHALGDEKKEEPKPTTIIKKQEPVVTEVKVIAETKVTDTDGDGIKDDADECLYIKGGIKTNGCPDTDNDGTIDMKDKCPMEPGALKTNGCPEAKISIDKTSLIKNFNNIEFETGRAVVKTADVYDIIEYAIDIMYEHPESRAILSGHTDSEGNELFNMQLSKERTWVVKKYLIKKGIDESRIQTIEYGETMPLMDNTTEYGKSKNRRVEINIIR